MVKIELSSINEERVGQFRVRWVMVVMVYSLIMLGWGRIELGRFK